MKGGSQALIARLKDPALRPRLENEINHGIAGTNWYNHYTATGSWEGMLLVSLSNPKYKQFEGKRMSEVIRGAWASRASTCCSSCWITTTARSRRSTSTIPKTTCGTR